ncbi:3-keto-steroid reductase, partial [Coemansia sp. RSA 2559]
MNSAVLDYSNVKIAVITGANNGVGFSIARRLLAEHHPSRFVVVLACRNLKRAEAARASLLAQMAVPPGGSNTAVVHLVELDTSSVASVMQAANSLCRLVPRIDLLFCNAGAMAIEGLDVFGIVCGLLTHPIAFFESSEALRQRRGALSDDGLGLTFQTNVFGHYMLIHKLIPLMQNHNARIIWTGSSASQLDFLRSDYQHIHGCKAYESSKFIVDQIAVPLDDRLQRLHGIRCYVAEPGNVFSGFLASLDNPPLLALIIVAYYFIRTVLGLSRFTITSENA